MLQLQEEIIEKIKILIHHFLLPIHFSSMRYSLLYIVAASQELCFVILVFVQLKCINM